MCARHGGKEKKRMTWTQAGKAFALFLLHFFVRVYTMLHSYCIIICKYSIHKKVLCVRLDVTRHAFFASPLQKRRQIARQHSSFSRFLNLDTLLSCTHKNLSSRPGPLLFSNSGWSGGGRMSLAKKRWWSHPSSPPPPPFPLEVLRPFLQEREKGGGEEGLPLSFLRQSRDRLDRSESLPFSAPPFPKVTGFDAVIFQNPLSVSPPLLLCHGKKEGNRKGGNISTSFAENFP